MNLPFFFGVTTGVDPTSSSIISLIGSLGSAGAAVAVAWMFLAYLKSESIQRETEVGRRDKRWEELADRYAGVIKDNSDAMRQFSIGVNTICREGQRPK